MKNKNIFCFFAVSAVLFTLLRFSASAESETPSTSAHAAALYEPETKQFLYSKNINKRMPMASTTKIMTAIVAIENSELDESVVIADEAQEVEGSSAYLVSGEILTMEELLYALMLRSANDAAAAIAYHISGGIEEFADLMNEKATRLGLSDTHFTNPHGLDDKEHYTTAHDLAIIAANALENDTLKEIIGTYKKSFSSDEHTRTYVNHNKLLKLCDGAIGVKTGFTKKSGRCLVGAVERDGLTFVTVTLNAPDDWRDHSALFELGYESLEKISLADKEEYSYDLSVFDGEAQTVRVKNEQDASIIVEKGEHEVDSYIKLARFAVAPIKQGDILGEVIFTVDGERVSSVKLVAEREVIKKDTRSFFEKLIDKFKINKGN